MKKNHFQLLFQNQPTPNPFREGNEELPTSVFRLPTFLFFSLPSTLYALRSFLPTSNFRLPSLICLILTFFSIPDLSAQRSFIIHDNLKRTFSVHLPTSFNKTERLPLLIALHGRGGNGKSMVLVTRKGFDKLADQERFIVVYPDGLGQSWNDGRMDAETDDRAHIENIDDVGFISVLIDLMITDYNLDPKRVYITGISNGAMLSYRLACELSGKITAIAPVDGSIPDMLVKGCSPTEPVSVLAINNVNDPMVPYEGGQIFNHFHRKKLGEVLSVNESIGFWMSHNNCINNAIISDLPDNDPTDGTRVKRTQFINGNKGTEVILYSVYGGGHTWPGGLQYLPVRVIGRTSKDFDANTVIWEFFKRHSK